VQTVVLWNTRDLGYLTVYAGALAAEEKLTLGARALPPGGWGRSTSADRKSFSTAAAFNKATSIGSISERAAAMPREGGAAHAIRDAGCCLTAR